MTGEKFAKRHEEVCACSGRVSVPIMKASFLPAAEPVCVPPCTREAGDDKVHCSCRTSERPTEMIIANTREEVKHLRRIWAQ